MTSGIKVNVEIKVLEPADIRVWDNYVYNHPGSNLYHLSGWHEVIHKAYGHRPYCLAAVKGQSQAGEENAQNEIPVAGILPLIHLNHFIFGNRLVSMPYFDLGGVLADDGETETTLLDAAVALGRRLKVNHIELRHPQPVSWLKSKETLESDSGRAASAGDWFAQVQSHKVRMILDLPGSADVLLKSFKAKLRSQILKPTKEGLKAKIGGTELLDEFYRVFSINMRDLGSPVHSMRLIEEVMNRFGSHAKIVVVHQENRPLACSLVVGFKDTLENPWASALAKYSRLSPNMLLYWTMLEYACDNGYGRFDFGRSSPGEGTYKFKEQWGAQAHPLYWYYLGNGGSSPGLEASERSQFDQAVRIWQRLPVAMTRIIGPIIRKHISL